MASGHRKIIMSRHKPWSSSGGRPASSCHAAKITIYGWSTRSQPPRHLVAVV